MKKVSLPLFLIVFFLTFWVRISAVGNGNFPFTIDQGRDLIDIRSIAVGGKLRLTGPTTSINGVFLGPLWYYFNLPPFIATGGDPAAPLLWQIIWYQLAGLSVYLLIRRTDHNLAFFTAVFFLLMPLGFNTSRYFWNANAMPIFTVFYLLSLYLVSLKTNPFRAALLGLAAGLALQIEAALGIIFFPFSFLFLFLTTRKIKVHLFHLFAFLATLLPQALFEIRHGFSMTKVFLSEVGGGSSLLGKKMTLGERLADRWEIIRNLVTQISHIHPNLLFSVFALLSISAVYFLIKKIGSKAERHFFVINLAFLIFAFIFYLLFPKEIKSWYLLGLAVPLIFLYTSSLSLVFGKGGSLARIAVILLVALSLFSTYQAQSEYLKVAAAMSTNNKSSLKNEMQMIDWIYRHADGKGFKAYSYLPSIYDYPYQYLYWWYGNKQYGYVPNDLAYLPNQPEYIENRLAYLTATRPLPNEETVFLIIEDDNDHPDFLSAWRGNFAHLCLREKEAFPFGVKLESLFKCSK